MKKGTVITLCVAGALLVFGLLLCIAAVIFGAEPVKLFSDGSYTIQTDGLNIGISSNDSGDKSAPVEPGKSYTVDEKIEKVYVNWVSGGVRVEPSTDGTISFFEESSQSLTEKTALTYSVNEGRLTIKWAADNPVFGIDFGVNFPDKQLIVYLPDNVKELSVDATSADIYVSDLSLEKSLNVSTVSGDAEVVDSYARNAKLNSTSGRLEFGGECYEFYGDSISGRVGFDGKCQEFGADTTSGKVEAEFSDMPHEVDIDTVSGSVTLVLPDNADFELDFETVSGSLDSELPLDMKGGEYFCGRGENEISVDTVSGSLKIK